MVTKREMGLHTYGTLHCIHLNVLQFQNNFPSFFPKLLILTSTGGLILSVIAYQSIEIQVTHKKFSVRWKVVQFFVLYLPDGNGSRRLAGGYDC